MKKRVCYQYSLKELDEVQGSERGEEPDMEEERWRLYFAPFRTVDKYVKYLTGRMKENTSK